MSRYIIYAGKGFEKGLFVLTQNEDKTERDNTESQKQKVVRSFFLILLAIVIASATIIYYQNDEITRLKQQLDFANSKASAVTSSSQASKSSKTTQTTKTTSSNSSVLTQSSVTSKSSTVMVWIPRTGKKYHKKSTCSNMKNPSQVTVSEAKSRGYDPCSKCGPPK